MRSTDTGGRPVVAARRLVAAGGLACLVAWSAAAAQLAPPDRHTVSSDGHPMAVWGRQPGEARRAILLVHGRTWSSRPDFDLRVPGLQRSVMVSLSARGFATYAVDLRGYGGTPRDATGWLTPRRAAADILNVLRWVRRQHPSLPPPAVLGWSRGAALAMLAAQMAPDDLSALVLFGFSFDPDLVFAEPDYPDRPAMATNTATAAESDFVSPAVTPDAVVRAFVAQALAADPVTVDLRNDGELNALDPSAVEVPTMMLFGERDINVPVDVGTRLFAGLATPDKRLVELPGADHAAHLEDTHDAWVAAVAEFLDRPPARR